MFDPPRVSRKGGKTMAAPSGHWRIIANGFQGNLDIQVDAQGNVTGTIEIDAPNVEQVHGFWDEAEQRIIFQRPVKLAGGSPQNYTGFLFLASQPLFQDGIFGPPQHPAFRMLAGSFDAFGTGGSGARPLFGWVARQNI
jgi:hypothetical protein